MTMSISNALQILRPILPDRQASTNEVDEITRIANNARTERLAEASRAKLEEASAPEEKETSTEVRRPKRGTLTQVPGGGFTYTLSDDDVALAFDFRRLRSMVIGEKPATELRGTFQTRLVEATTLNPPVSQAWSAEIEKATEDFGFVVSHVIEFNAEFHTLDRPMRDGKVLDIQDFLSDPQLIAEDFATFEAASYFQARETLNMALAEHEGLSGLVKMQLDWDIQQNRMNGAIHQIENGEYRLSSYQFKASDGRVVAELKDNGHFVTYREDGSVLRDRNRADVCIDMCTSNWSFGRLSTLTKSEDKDLMFY